MKRDRATMLIAQFMFDIHQAGARSPDPARHWIPREAGWRRGLVAVFQKRK